MAVKMRTTSLLLLICLSVSFTQALLYPLHASCKIDWTFSVSCDQIENRLVGIIERWKGPEGCAGGGEKCLYTLQSRSSTEIKAVHETPVKRYKDDLTFTLTSKTGGCAVHGYSTSETWYAWLDKGTNYCNLRNLIDGADLNRDPAFKEETSNSQCTQYSSHDCDKY